jgi:hypothetical protein
MRKINIPEPHQIALVKISSLDDDSMSELSTAIERTKVTLTPLELADKLAENVTHIPKDDLEQILWAVIAMHWARDRENVPLSEFAEEVCRSLDETKVDALKLKPERRDIFKQRITRLLAPSSSLAITARAVDVLTEHERIFTSARIITDIRSVFSDPSEKPSAAFIVHMLNIHYRQGREKKEFFVALDSDDIAKLKEVLDRAEKKAKSLATLLDASGIHTLDTSLT